MAYVNVKDWSVEQVTDWLKGLDNVILPYIKSFLNNGVNGHQLLNLRVDDLEHLGVSTLGHQEIILESVEHIRNFHYELDKENLQTLALRLSCAANSLNRELQFADENATKVQTQTMSDVHNIISTIKPLVCWLDWSPFAGDKDYNDSKRTLLQLGFEMATSAHRDIFSEKPIRTIRDICEKLTKLADRIIQEISDPMILQPATLDLTTLKKKEQELGFFILPSNNALHQIAEIKYGSPAHLSTKIEEGDEIVQVNYQTVVGWQRKLVMLLLQESPPEIVLTLKKRPRHTKVYGQIYMKPYRLPSKKRAAPYSRWNENLPSPRLLAIHDLPQITLPKAPVIPAANDLDSETSSSGSDSETPDSPLDNGGRLYPLKPRSVLQRRNTITGATPTNTRTSPAVEQYWKILKDQATSSYNLPTSEKFKDESMFIRDKSASCSHGLELTQRPTTVIGLASKNSFKQNFNNNNEKPAVTKKIVNFDETKTTIINDSLSVPAINKSSEEKLSLSTTSLSSLKDEVIEFIDEAEDLQDRSKMTLLNEIIVNAEEKTESVVSVKTIKEIISEKSKIVKVTPPVVKDTVLEDVHVDNIIKKFDKRQSIDEEKPKILPRSINKAVTPMKPPVIPRTMNKIRGKLDKSHSTPAYDLTADENNDTTTTNDSFLLLEDIEKMTSKSSAINSDVKLPESSIRYELGIPTIITTTHHSITYPPTTGGVDAKKRMNRMDVPPKPPPRTNIPEQYKRKPIGGSGDEIVTTTTTLKLDDNSNNNKSEKKTDFVDNNTEKQQIITSSFEPISVSTPISKQFKDDILKVDTHKSNETKTATTHKTSPTNLVVRAICSTKNKSTKKKNSLIAKKRKVSVNDVSPGEMQGYLQQRLRSKHNQNVHWERRWFVLNQHCLYGFKSKESTKAECYIYLAGFTVTVANEVKSRANAFKVYHTGTVFYFSTENEENLMSWLDMITAATFNNTDPMSTNEQILFSETDDDDDSDAETNSSTKSSSTLDKHSSESSLKKFNSLKKFATSSSKKRSDNNSVSGSTSLDRKWFFNKSSSPKNALPVPTSQFRSYRKIPASTTIGNFTSHIPNFANKVELPTLQPPSTTTDNASASIDSIPSAIQETEPPPPPALAAYQKPKIINHLHASNPTLCNMEYNTFHHPFHVPKPKHHDNLGFVTLEELMNRESDERRCDNEPLLLINSNLICPDVVYGEVPIRCSEYRSAKKTHLRTASDCSDSKKESSCFGKRSSSIKGSSHSLGNAKLKANSSLPRTSKQYDSILASKQKSTSSKSLAKNKERSYEMIYCPQTTTTDIQFAQNRTLDGHRMFQQETPPSKKSGGGLKSALQYTPMALPLTAADEKLKLSTTQYSFELNLDEKATSTQRSGKFKHFFMKQDSKKEKKSASLSSSHQQQKLTKSSGFSSSFDHGGGETWRHHNHDDMIPHSASDSFATYHHLLPSNNIEKQQQRNNSPPPPADDYPGLEYPPVFEPETYSLANPQATLFRNSKQSKN